MAHAFSDPRSMPHLAAESPEFLALADCEAVVEGVVVPLHRQQLARASRVFAQLFNSLPPEPAAARVAVTPLLEGYDLRTVLLAAFLLYNGDPATVRAVFEQGRWGALPDAPPVALEADLLQLAVGLADKLDARRLLCEVEAACARGALLKRDLLGWLATGVRLHLPWLRDRALTEIVTVLHDRGAFRPALALLRDPRWRELDAPMLLLLIDAMAAHKYRPHERWVFSADAWREMGDLTAAQAAARFPEAAQLGAMGALGVAPAAAAAVAAQIAALHPGGLPPAPGPAFPLEAQAEAQHLQAIDDLEAMFNAGAGVDEGDEDF